MPSKLTPEMLAALEMLLFQGQKIAAIKMYREVVGSGLAESKAAMDDLERDLRQRRPESFQTAAAGDGRFLYAVMAMLALIGVAVAGALLVRR